MRLHPRRTGTSFGWSLVLAYWLDALINGSESQRYDDDGRLRSRCQGQSESLVCFDRDGHELVGWLMPVCNDMRFL